MIYSVQCSSTPFIRKRVQTTVIAGSTTTLPDDGGSPSATNGHTGSTSNDGELQAFGDSITVGIGAGFPIPGVNEFQYSFINVLAGDLGLSAVNHGLNGSQCAGEAPTMFTQGVLDQQLSVWLTGYNDMRADGTDSAGQATYSACLTSMLAYLAIPDSGGKVAGQSVSGVTYTGVWSSDPNFAVGKTTSTPAATATISLAGSGTLYLAYASGPSYAGSFTVTVDGGAPATINGNAGVRAPEGNTGGFQPSPNFYRVPGLAAGLHTVVVTQTSGAVYYEWAAIVPATGFASPPNVYVGNCLHMPEAGYSGAQYYSLGSDTAVGQFNAIIAGDVAALRSDGLTNIVLVNADGAYNPATQQAGDNIHPGTSGHASIAAAFNAAIS